MWPGKHNASAETQGVGLVPEDLQGCVWEALDITLESACSNCNEGPPALIVRVGAGAAKGASASSQDIEKSACYLSCFKKVIFIT